MCRNDELDETIINLKYEDIYYQYNKIIPLGYILDNEDEYDSALIMNNGIYIDTSTILPVRLHQADDDLLELEKEFAVLIYSKRDYDRE